MDPANRDGDDARRYDTAGLPDPLHFTDGTPVRTPEEWRARRRPEVLELFRTHVYGRVPDEPAPRQRSEVLETTPGVMDGAATRKRVRLVLSGDGTEVAVDLLLFVPTRTAAGRPPVTLFLNNRGPEHLDPARAYRSPFWPAEEIVRRGYAAAALDVDRIAPDRPDGTAHGVFRLFSGPRRPDSWGVIAAWAWGASRALDYLLSDPDNDAARTALVGHSRGGKAALWAGAQDERFALAFSNDSGCTGAAISRGKRGERIADINRAFPHWFCPNYRRFDHLEDALPVDQHHLLALHAPRPLYVASATDDAWADPPSEFRGCLGAGPVYGLFGLRGVVGSDRLPPPERPLHAGSIGYHLRTGIHDLTPYDWGRLLDFADRRLPAPMAAPP